MAMKQTLLATAVALMAVPAFASEPTGWYIAGGAGITAAEDFEASALVPPLTSVSAEFDSGWAGLAAGGYDFGRWRIEAEFSYRHNDLDHFLIAVAPGPFARVLDTSGEMTNLGLLANLLYDIELSNALDVYVGGGIGFSRSDLEVRTPATVIFDDQDWGFTWQGIVGANVQLTNSLSLFADYRYYVHENFSPSARAPALGGREFRDDGVWHSGFVGLRYTFAKPAAAPEVVEPETPKPVEAVREFVVFFDFDKANLTSDARTVVAEAAAAAKAGSNVKITVTGHTDTVGSQAYNQRLSERRANAVKAELVRQGLGDGDITTVGKSFNEPAVNTGPGVKEPRNRRAVIDLQ